MARSDISPFAFLHGVEAVEYSPSPLPIETLPEGGLVITETPVSSELANLFPAHVLTGALMDALRPDAERFEALSNTGLKGAIASALEFLQQSPAAVEIGNREELIAKLSEECVNHELLAAFRRLLLGG